MIDAHHHFWHFNAAEYGWIDDSMALLRRDYLANEFVEEMQRAEVTGSVVVQARQTIQETEWLLEIAETTPQVLGVVGWLPLKSPELDIFLKSFRERTLLKGLRHVVQDEQDDDFLLAEDFTRGIAALKGTGLAFDLLVRPSQLHAANGLVRRFPDQKFILDHLAKPDIQGRQNLQSWRKQIFQLSECANVYCKLSGLVTEADWQTWTPAQLQPFLNTALEAFGPDRVMAGSDWPVCLVASSYKRWWDTLREWCAALNQSAQDQILHSNSVRFYSLRVPGEQHIIQRKG